MSYVNGYFISDVHIWHLIIDEMDLVTYWKCRRKNGKINIVQ